MAISRRGLLTGLGAALLAAPAIVRASSLMPVKALPQTVARQIPAGWEIINEWKAVVRVKYKIIELTDQERVELLGAQVAAVAAAA